MGIEPSSAEINIMLAFHVSTHVLIRSQTEQRQRQFRFPGKNHSKIMILRV